MHLCLAGARLCDILHTDRCTEMAFLPWIAHLCGFVCLFGFSVCSLVFFFSLSFLSFSFRFSFPSHILLCVVMTALQWCVMGNYPFSWAMIAGVMLYSRVVISLHRHYHAPETYSTSSQFNLLLPACLHPVANFFFAQSTMLDWLWNVWFGVV